MHILWIQNLVSNSSNNIIHNVFFLFNQIRKQEGLGDEEDHDLWKRGKGKGK
jgi:hypothetical protein